jgi:hypothetical protein
MLELECGECGDETALLEDHQVVERSIQSLVVLRRVEQDEHAVVTAGGGAVHLSQRDPTRQSQAIGPPPISAPPSHVPPGPRW